MPRVDPDSEVDGYYTGIGKAGEDDGGVGAIVIGGVEHFGPEFEWGDPIRASRAWKKMSPEKRKAFIKYKSNRPKKGVNVDMQRMQAEINDLKGSVELLTQLIARKEGIDLGAKTTEEEAVEDFEMDSGQRKRKIVGEAPWKDRQPTHDPELAIPEELAEMEDAFETPEDESLVDDAALDGFLAGTDDEGDVDLDAELAALPERKPAVQLEPVRERKPALRRVPDKPSVRVDDAFPEDFWDGYS